MKLLTTVAVGALVLAGCAPFEHGHYASDVVYDGRGPVGPAPVAYDAGPVGAGFGLPHSAPATYSTPVSYAEPASYVEPVIQQPIYQPPVHHRTVHQAPIHHEAPVHHGPIHQEPVYQQASFPPPAPLPYSEPVAHASFPPPVHVEPPRYIDSQPRIEPASGYTVDTYAQPLPAPIHSEPHYVEPPRYVDAHPHPAPLATAFPVSKPHHQYVDAGPVSHPAPIFEQAPPVVAATSVSVAEERVQAPVSYAPPEVVNAPPVFMRGAPQYANQPYPAPPYPQFGAPQRPPSYGPPAPQFPPAFGYGQPQGFGGYSQPFAPQPMPGFGGYGGPAVAANTRGGYAPQGYGYGGGGCVTTCANGTVY